MTEAPGLTLSAEKTLDSLPEREDDDSSTLKREREDIMQYIM
jgi:hypothetical protein